MQGRHVYQPTLIPVVDMEKLIPKNHLLRKIDKVLDLSFIYKETEHLYCKDNGRPSVDPELFVRMNLITYLYNIASGRKLCEEIQYNLAYRWFCKLSLEDQVPFHSSMTRTRDRFGEEVFQKIFFKIIDLCRQEGLVKGERLVGDATLLEANASLYSFIKNEDLAENKQVKDYKKIQT